MIKPDKSSPRVSWAGAGQLVTPGAYCSGGFLRTNFWYKQNCFLKAGGLKTFSYHPPTSKKYRLVGKGQAGTNCYPIDGITPLKSLVKFYYWNVVLKSEYFYASFRVLNIIADHAKIFQIYLVILRKLLITPALNVQICERINYLPVLELVVISMLYHFFTKYFHAILSSITMSTNPYSHQSSKNLVFRPTFHIVIL